MRALDFKAELLKLVGFMPPLWLVAFVAVFNLSSTGKPQNLRAIASEAAPWAFMTLLFSW